MTIIHSNRKLDQYLQRDISRTSLLRCIFKRLLLLGVVASYAFAFIEIYITYLSPFWSYFEFKYYPPTNGYMFGAWVMALLPALWMPIVLVRPSQVIYWVLYLLTYIPSAFTPLFMRERPPDEVMIFIATLLGGMAIMGAVQCLPIPRIHCKPLPPFAFWAIFLLVIAFLTGWVIAVFHSSMHLVSFEDVYALRTKARVEMQGTGVGYGVGLMLMIFNPLLMAIGINRKRKSLFVLGAAGQLLIYLAVGLKAEILSIPLVLGIYVICRLSTKDFGLLFSGAGASALLILVLLIPVAQRSRLVEASISLVAMRTVGMAGMLSGEYHAYFMTHPLTYFSHAKPFSFFMLPQYPQPLGYEVGGFYKPGIGINENAHFWVSDGMAGLGLPGVLVISLAMGGVLWMLDLASARHRVPIIATFLVYIGVQLGNMPLTTMLGTFGLGAAIPLLFLMPANGLPEKQPDSEATFLGT